MSNELKCPFCQQELKLDYTGVMYCCNEDCKSSADWYGSKVLWQELIRTHKALDVAVDILKEIDETRCAVDANLYAVNHKLLNAGNVFCWTTPDEIHNALEQIQHWNKRNSKH